MNADLKIITDWCYANKLALNTQKTKAMLFTTKVNFISPRLYISNSELEYVDVYKYLGVKIDKMLKFNEHIDSLKSKLARVVGISFSIGKLVDTSTARLIYFSLAHSHIIYLISVWGHSGTTRLNEVQIQQNKIIRNLFKHRFPLLSTSELFVRCNLLKIKDIYTLELGKLMFLTLNTVKYPLLNQHLDSLQWTHNYNSRKINVYRLPFARIRPDYNSFLFQAVKTWNDFPIQVRNTTSLYQFKTELSRCLLSSVAL